MPSNSKVPKSLSKLNLDEICIWDENEEVEMEDLSEKSKWNQLVTTITDIGVHVKEKAIHVFEKKLGSSSKNNQNHFEDEFGFDEGSLSSSRLLQQTQDSLQRSYGAISVSVGNEGHPAQSKGIINKLNSSNSGGYFYERISSNLIQSQFSPSAPPDSKLITIPIINIQQDDNFLTVETSFRPGLHGSLSSGFNSSPPSPAPTFGGSTAYDFNSFEKPDKFTKRRYFKIAILIGIFVSIAGIITATSETEMRFVQITASLDDPYIFPLKAFRSLAPFYPLLIIRARGAFFPEQFSNFTTNRLYVDVERQGNNKEVSERWELPIFIDNNIGAVSESTFSHAFTLNTLYWHNGSYNLVFRTNTKGNFPLAVSVKLVSQVVENGAVYGGAVILALYILIIFELVNRTLAAMLAATAAIGILALFDERPTTKEMVSWLDMETLILLFSMMVLVSILCETGFFDYCSYFMYKITSGQVWPMITLMCLFTAVVSAFLDNVTTILLMTPVTIRICEAMELNPVPILISLVIFSNIGGACTPVGDPPNVIISNDKDVIESGIDFATFSTHMLLGIIPVMIVSYIQLRITFRSMKSLQFSEPYEVAELRREIEVWTRTADSLSSFSKDESHVKALLLSKVVHLRNKLKAKMKMGGQSVESYKASLMELKESCKIRDWPLLIKCGIVLSFVIILFFLHSIPQLNLSMGWTALLGVVMLLILSDPKELEGILSRVEWSTLIFFSALFVVMESVAKLGLLEWIGTQTEEIILNVNQESRLTVAILLILWVSGIASAFIDNIPFTTMMIKIVTRVSSRIGLPLQPLIWALAFGTCLGGNGTLIGASANVVCAGVADQHGYRFTFMEYFKIGFPMMIVSLIVASGYLTFCHSFFQWNS